MNPPAASPASRELRQLLGQVKLRGELEYRAAKRLGQPDAQALMPVLFPSGGRQRSRVPTLHSGCFQSMTPMLEERFKNCGRWACATFGHTWLGLQDMASMWTSPRLLRPVVERKESWLDSPPAIVPWERLSVFGIDYDKGGGVYLVWPEAGAEEPRVAALLDEEPREFDNLAGFLPYCAGAAS